jgi:hypothetical protein
VLSLSGMMRNPSWVTRVRNGTVRAHLARPSDVLERSDSIETIQPNSPFQIQRLLPEDVVSNVKKYPVGRMTSGPLKVSEYFVERCGRDFRRCLHNSKSFQLSAVVFAFVAMAVVGTFMKLVVLFDSLVYIYLKVSLGLSPTSQREQLRNHHLRLSRIDGATGFTKVVDAIARKINALKSFCRNKITGAQEDKSEPVSQTKSKKTSNLDTEAANNTTITIPVNNKNKTSSNSIYTSNSLNWFEEAYYRSKKYAFVIFNFASFVVACMDREHKHKFALDEYIFRYSINSTHMTILVSVVLTVFTYMNYHMSHVVRHDISDFLQILIGERIVVLDNHFTFKRVLVDIVADLDTYGYVVLTCDNSMDIWLVSKDFSHMTKEVLNELIRENYFYDNRTFRKIRVRTKGLLECAAYNSTECIWDDAYVRVSNWSLGFDWHSLDPRKVNFYICLHDMKIYDVLSCLILAMFYFTSNKFTKSYWLVVFAILLICFGLLAVRRLRFYSIISLAEFTRSKVFRRVRNLEVKAGLPEEQRPLHILLGMPVNTLFDDVKIFKEFNGMFMYLLLCQTKKYPRESLQGFNVMQLFDFYSSVCNATAIRVVVTFNHVPIFKMGGLANPEAVNNVEGKLRINDSTFKHPLIVRLYKEGCMEIDKETQDEGHFDYIDIPENLDRTVKYNKIKLDDARAHSMDFTTSGLRGQPSFIAPQDNPMLATRNLNGTAAPPSSNLIHHSLQPRLSSVSLPGTPHRAENPTTQCIRPSVSSTNSYLISVPSAKEGESYNNKSCDAQLGLHPETQKNGVDMRTTFSDAEMPPLSSSLTTPPPAISGSVVATDEDTTASSADGVTRGAN